MSNKIIMVRSSGVSPDSRLEKEAATLGKFGNDVSILAWDRKCTLPIYENKGNYTIYRLGIRSPNGSMSVLYHLPIWWINEFRWLISHPFDIIHAVDFDTLIPALVVAKLRRRKVFYDIFDMYSELISLPRPISKIASKLELWLMNRADEIIIVDHCRYKQIKKNINSPNVCVIYNTPPDKVNHQINTKQIKNTLNIFYGGVLSKDRDIISMINIVSESPDINFNIAGFGNMDIISNIEAIASKYDNITYLGTIPYEKVLSYSQDADILFALYDPSVPNNKVASPNKLFEAMMLGKPIIVNEGTAATDKVREENCGLVVPYGDVDALRDAVLKLKNNPQLRKELGENGRRAYETKYSWTIMEKRLLDLYKSLESEQYK